MEPRVDYVEFLIRNCRAVNPQNPAVLPEGLKVKYLSNWLSFQKDSFLVGFKVCAVWDIITQKLSGLEGLRGSVTFLEIVFVGQCEVFVCVDFVHYFFFFSLGCETHRNMNGVSIL